MSFEEALAGRTLSADGGSLVLAEWRDGGGGSQPPLYIAPLHVHHADDEAWYVLEGELIVRSGSTDVHLTAGGAVIVPRGTPHTYWNPTAAPTRYLLAMTERIRALIDALHATEDRAPQTIERTFREHESEFLGWPS
ncbi:MAG TPA: cupin domain-containing protein [Solirubrobacteraceae bacterium]